MFAFHQILVSRQPVPLQLTITRFTPKSPTRAAMDPSDINHASDPSDISQVCDSSDINDASDPSDVSHVNPLNQSREVSCGLGTQAFAPAPSLVADALIGLVGESPAPSAAEPPARPTERLAGVPSGGPELGALGVPSPEVGPGRLP
jgi:hypothetical protein